MDDGLFVCSSKTVLASLIQLMERRYTLKIMFNPTSILGIQVDYDRLNTCMYLNQCKYIMNAAERFKMSDTRPYSTPMEAGFIASVTPDDTPAPATAPYRALLGSLLHVGRMTRADIMYSVNILAKHMTAPQVKHWNAAKRILAYLVHTNTFVLKLGGNNKFVLEAYSDSTWADDTVNRRSRTGGVLLFAGSSLTCWTTQQATFALSSTEAEYQAFTTAAQQILYYRQVLSELGYEQSLCLVITKVL